MTAAATSLPDSFSIGRTSACLLLSLRPLPVRAFPRLLALTAFLARGLRRRETIRIITPHANDPVIPDFLTATDAGLRQRGVDRPPMRPAFHLTPLRNG